MTELEYPAIANTDSLARKFKRTNRLITNKVIYAFLNCKYKASLISKDCQGNISDYEQLQEELLTDSKKTFFHEKRIKARKFYDKQVLNGISITYEDSLFIEPYIKNIEFEIGFHLLERTDFDSINPQWVLYLIISSETPQLIDKIYLAILLIILKRNNIGNIDDGIIIYGKHQRQSKILLNQYHNEALKVFADLTNALNGNEGILPNLNKHCAICQYQAFCLKIMQEKDSLSLLRGLSPKQISKLNNKGIFTIHQFSYTFKPKKKKNNPKPVRLEYALKALALREKKTYIIEIPHLPKSETKIYLDIESLNDESFYYLIGMHINSNNRIDTYSFWSDTPENVETTYTNGLKEIGNSLGYKWSFDNASGIQSIVWRKKWELTNNDNFKQLLINYNQEDCRALKIVTEWIERIEAINIENNDDYINANSLKNDTYLKWGKQEFLIPDFEILNTYSYFDYQRSKIFIRTNKSIKKAVKRHINLKDHDKINNEISYVPVNCPNCGYSKFYPHNKNKAVVIDIKFMENGIKKWVIQFPASSFECCDCNFVFGFNKYGRNLMIWSINQYVLYLTSMPKIKSMLQENFNINIDETYLYNFKTDLAKEYLDTYNEIKETIFSGNLWFAKKVSSKTCFWYR